MTAVGWIGERLGVPDHPRGEDDFTCRGAGSAEDDAGEHRAVLEDQPAPPSPAQFVRTRDPHPPPAVLADPSRPTVLSPCGIPLWPVAAQNSTAAEMQGQC